MRVHQVFGVAVIAVTAAALFATAGHARPNQSFNVPVRITNTGCVVGYPSVSGAYTRIVFGVFNNGTVSHGFDISTKFKTGLIKEGQERTLIADFGRAGAYRYACVGKDSTVKKGIFTIR
jgi:hypothetical protein